MIYIMGIFGFGEKMEKVVPLLHFAFLCEVLNFG